MLQSSLKPKIIKLPIFKDFVIVHFLIKDKIPHRIIMAPITEKDEFFIDANDFIQLTIKDKPRRIDKNNILFYGNIDFSVDSRDLDIIEHMNLIPLTDGRGYSIPAYYNYKEHNALGNEKGPYHYDTIRTDLVLKYKHGCLGKPERVIVWKDTTKYNK